MTRDDMDATTAEAAGLTEDMLAMDVADTLRHHPDLLPSTPLDAQGGESFAPLAAYYRQLGLSVPETALRAGIAAAAQGRFTYNPPTRGLGPALARLYVVRRKWLPGAVAVGLIFLIGYGGYFFGYRPWHEAQLRQSRIELTEIMPARMDALYQTIFEETKVQQASNDAAGIRARGKDAASNGDRAGAQAAIDELTRIRDTLRQDYQIRIVDRPDAKWGFWTFPKSNSEATNYYLVVEAVDGQGQAVSLPIRNEDTGRVETVARWGERVPEDVYRAVEADKADDGAIEHNLVGIKDFGFLEPDYLVDVLGGELTRW
ncbi:MAG TPA: DUF6384 family protein [Devosia sp.]|nr:DUF6384 family protein [Devosia sp.]